MGCEGVEEQPAGQGHRDREERKSAPRSIPAADGKDPYRGDQVQQANQVGEIEEGELRTQGESSQADLDFFRRPSRRLHLKRDRIPNLVWGQGLLHLDHIPHRLPIDREETVAGGNALA